LKVSQPFAIVIKEEQIEPVKLAQLFKTQLKRNNLKVISVQKSMFESRDQVFKSSADEWWFQTYLACIWRIFIFGISLFFQILISF
jgi:hypothetical protein